MAEFEKITNYKGAVGPGMLFMLFNSNTFAFALNCYEERCGAFTSSLPLNHWGRGLSFCLYSTIFFK
jgi:hypothetical protein